MRRTMLADFESPIDAEGCGGVPEAMEKVECFVQEKIVDNAEIEGDVTLELCQIGAGSSMVLQSWLFSQGDEPSTVAATILDSAQEHGNKVASGKTKFKLSIRGFRGQCSFVLEYGTNGEDDEDEVPNGMGLVAQALKHSREAWTMARQVMQQSFVDNREQRKTDQARIRDLEGGQIETVQTLAALYDAKHARDLETKKIEKSESRKDEVAGFLMQGIPAIINKVVGSKAVTETSTPLEQMLHGLLSTFRNEQLQEMTTTGVLRLEQAQVMGILGMFQSLQDRHDAREAAAGRGPQASVPEPVVTSPQPSTTPSYPVPPGPVSPDQSAPQGA